MRRTLRHGAALAFFAVLAIAYTWPLARHLGTHFPDRAAEPEAFHADQLFISWILTQDAHALLHDPLHVFESNNLHPFRHTLAYSENLIGMAALILPVHVAARNPVLNLNAAMLLALVLGGFGTFLLVRELSGSALAGLVAGALTVYAPPVWANLLLLQMLAGQWAPIALLALVRAVRTRRFVWSLALGASAALQVWTSLHQGTFLALGLTATTAVLVVASRAARRALPQLAFGGVLALALALPVLLPYRQVSRELGVESRPGAVAMSLAPSQFTPPWTRAFSYLAERARSGTRIAGYATLTPWILMAAGLLAALARRPRRVDAGLLTALAAGAVANLLLAMGPLPHPWLPSLYAVLAEWVPGVETLRAPLRAASYAHLIVCVLGGVGLGSVLRRVSSRAVRLTIAAAALALGIVEAGRGSIALIPAPPRPAALPLIERLDARCPIAELPTGLLSGALALFRSTYHWRPLVTGYSGYYPLSPGVAASLLATFPGPAALAFLEEAGACAVVVRADVGPANLARIATASRARGLAVESAGDELLVRLPPPAPRPMEAASLPRDAWRAEGDDGAPVAVVLDGDLRTLWRARVGTSDPPARLRLDAGAPLVPSTLEVALGSRFPLYLRTYRVEGSSDGETWTLLAESPLATPPLASYRADPSAVRQRIDLRPAPVRWLRVGPFREPPARGLDADVAWTEWAVAEVYVRGAVVAPTASTR